MISINAHFDGKVIVPDEPLDLPCDQALIVRVEPVTGPASPAREPALHWVAENAADSPLLPADLSHQHDHYLYGVLKKDT
ncbi:MAG: hypothetical protein AAB225_08415 [Acidobacteriota bacterium]